MVMVMMVYLYLNKQCHATISIPIQQVSHQIGIHHCLQRWRGIIINDTNANTPILIINTNNNSHMSFLAITTQITRELPLSLAFCNLIHYTPLISHSHIMVIIVMITSMIHIYIHMDMHISMMMMNQSSHHLSQVCFLMSVITPRTRGQPHNPNHPIAHQQHHHHHVNDNRNRSTRIITNTPANHMLTPLNQPSIQVLHLNLM